MALIAMAMPILPGKEGKWKEMMENLKKDPMKSQINGTREAAGVHERTFLQETPNGMMVIVTLEGNNPQEAFGKMLNDPAMKDFMAWATDVHGIDFSATPPQMPKLVYDSKA